MITGIGTDIVDIRRIEHSLETYGAKFEQRIFTETERAIALNKVDKPSHYAKRFAAKEAIAKALGTGFNEGVSWQDIEITSLPTGKPHISLYGKAKSLITADTNIHISLSDDGGFAIAYATIEAP